jgi:hypothetical protein
MSDDPTAAPPVVEVEDTGGWRVVWLGTADVRVGVVPALGGRVLSLATHAGEHLFRNPELLDGALHPAAQTTATRDVRDRGLGSWTNWGGDKTWPAPQGWSGPGEWPGPPDPVLDGGPYAASWASVGTSASVEMRSPADPRSGLRICRKVEVVPGASGYRLTSTFTNASDREVRWAIWHVVQLPGPEPDPEGTAGGALGTWVGNEPGRGVTVEHLIAGTGHVKVNEMCFHAAWVPPQDAVGKVGFPAATGWVAHVAAGRVTILRSVVEAEPTANYPDKGSRVEVWLEHPLREPLAQLGGLHPRHRITECEVLGPLQAIPPGSSTQLVSDVTGCSGEGPVYDVREGACLLEPLVVVTEESRLRVKARIGAFRTLPVALGFLDGNGALVGEVPLGPSSAGFPFEVRWAAVAPASTASVVVRLGATVVAEALAGRVGEQEGKA